MPGFRTGGFTTAANHINWEDVQRVSARLSDQKEGLVRRLEGELVEKIHGAAYKDKLDQVPVLLHALYSMEQRLNKLEEKLNG